MDQPAESIQPHDPYIGRWNRLRDSLADDVLGTYTVQTAVRAAKTVA